MSDSTTETDNSEIWVSFHFTSRAQVQPSVELINREARHLADLEDVVEYVFHQHRILPKHRPFTWWEKPNGRKVKSSELVDDLIDEGFGTQENPLKLFIEDVPVAMWFRYDFVHNPTFRASSQRIKFTTTPIKFEKFAHVTNYLFKLNYLEAHLRLYVYWENSRGKRIQESADVAKVLATGEGSSEDKPLRLVVNFNRGHDVGVQVGPEPVEGEAKGEAPEDKPVDDDVGI